MAKDDSNELIHKSKVVLPMKEIRSYNPAIMGCRSENEYHCLNKIGEGTYGVVYRAQDKTTQEIVALKQIKMEHEREGFPIPSLREVGTLLRVQHENIIIVREIVVGNNMDKIFLVMDYMELDLKSLMEFLKLKKQSFFPGEVKCLLQQLLRAVAHLHDNWIIHRDLKTSNILLSHSGILKVGDFGLAREYGSPLKPYTSVVVTLWYRAPELLLGVKEYSTPIDVWSGGCIFGELLTLDAMFQGKHEADQINKIFQRLGTPNDNIWPGYSELQFVTKVSFINNSSSNLRKKFASKLSELGLDLLQRFLTYSPARRISAEEALNHTYFKEHPLPIHPSMLPTWPIQSELNEARKAHSLKRSFAGRTNKQLNEDFHYNNSNTKVHMGNTNDSQGVNCAIPGFCLKF